MSAPHLGRLPVANHSAADNIDQLRLFEREYNHEKPSEWTLRNLKAAGYTIIASLGDQKSDLAGGHAEMTFKIPNPFCFIPEK